MGEDEGEGGEDGGVKYKDDRQDVCPANPTPVHGVPNRVISANQTDLLLVPTTGVDDAAEEHEHSWNKRKLLMKTNIYFILEYTH